MKILQRLSTVESRCKVAGLEERVKHRAWIPNFNRSTITIDLYIEPVKL